MKPFLFIVSLLLCQLTEIYGQCAFEQYHKIGGYTSITDCEIIEDVSGKSTFTFWDSTIDSANHQTQNNTEIWIVKNDSCGNRLWKKNIGYGEFTMDFFSDALLTPDSNILIVGYGEYTGQGAIYNCTVFKLNRDGVVLWKKAYGGRSASVASSVVYNPFKNSYFISGRTERMRTGPWNRAFVFEIDSAGNKLNEQDIIINNDSIIADIKLQKMNRVMVASDSTILGIITSQQADSIYLVKLTPDLKVIWIRKPFEKKYEPIGFAKAEFNIHTQQITAICGGYRYSDGLQASWILNIDTAGEIKQSHILDYPSETGSGFRLTKDGGYLFGYASILKYDSLFQITLYKKLSVIGDTYKALQDVLQLESGAFAGIGNSTVRSNNQYTELYITQSHPNGGFVGEAETINSSVPVSIYPNPSQGTFTIEGITPEQTLATVWNVNAQVVFKAELTNGSMNLSNQPDGLYVLQLTSSEGKLLSTQKISIVK